MPRYSTRFSIRERVAQRTSQSYEIFNLFMTFHSINYALLDRIVSRCVFSSGKERARSGMKKIQLCLILFFIWWRRINWISFYVLWKSRFGERKVSKSGKVGTKRTPDNFDHTIDEGKKFTVDPKSFLLCFNLQPEPIYIFFFAPFYFPRLLFCTVIGIS